MKLSDQDEPKHPEFCGVDCPCGHWNDQLRRATRRADGRRGKPNLDIIDSDHRADEVVDGTR